MLSVCSPKKLTSIEAEVELRKAAQNGKLERVKYILGNQSLDVTDTTSTVPPVTAIPLIDCEDVRNLCYSD